MSHRLDVIIVGGGAMGAATACYLQAADPSVSVAVIERDPSYRYASTVLSDGNVRIQFNLEENIRISQYAMNVLETFAEDMAVGDAAPDVTARHQGNLFLVDAAGRAEALAGMDRQQGLGCDVEWLDAAEIASRYPPYTGPGFVGGTLGHRDGSVDPDAVLRGYRGKAIALGVEFVAAGVARLLRDEVAVRGVALENGEEIYAPVVVNCAGAWAAELCRTVGVDLPVEPVMRNVFVVESDVDHGGGPLPSVFLPSGPYLIPEHDGTFLMAWSRPEDPIGFDFVVHRQSFYDHVWPEIVRHLPAFERLQVVRGWAGLYAVNTLDGNAILGEWPQLGGLYLANGFSGHGFQQCHAVGRYLSELILERPVTLDLHRLGPQRILDGRPLYEHAARII